MQALGFHKRYLQALGGGRTPCGREKAIRAHPLVRILSCVCACSSVPNSFPVSEQARNKCLWNDFGLDLTLLCSVLVCEVHHERGAKFNLILGVVSGLNIYL